MNIHNIFPKNYILSVGLEYADSISYIGVRPSSKRYCPEYIKLHFVVMVLFWNSGDRDVLLHCHWSGSTCEDLI